MDAERPKEPREFQLEGIALAVVGVVLLAAFAGTFYLGRWYERRSAPEAVALSADPLRHAERGADEVDVDAGVTVFDSVAEEGAAEGAASGGGAAVAEPERQARTPGPPPANTPAPGSGPGTAPGEAPAGGPSAPAAVARGDGSPAPPTGTAGGAHFVQVFAGRMRQSAERLVTQLEAAGYPVTVLSDDSGGERLYKVRVGGYPTREKADSVMQKLRDGGHPAAWVVTEAG